MIRPAEQARRAASAAPSAAPRPRVTAAPPTGPSAPSVSANTLYEGVPFLNEERWGSKAKRMLPEVGATSRARTLARLCAPEPLSPISATLSLNSN